MILYLQMSWLQWYFTMTPSSTCTCARNATFGNFKACQIQIQQSGWKGRLYTTFLAIGLGHIDQQLEKSYLLVTKGDITSYGSTIGSVHREKSDKENYK